MRLEDRITATIDERVERAGRPTPDLAATVHRGRRLRRRRTTAGLAAAVAAVVAGVVAVPQVPGLLAADPERPGPVGQLDYSEGLRAFASPDEDGKVWIGGRSFPAEDMGYLDTDATATAHGLVFFDEDMQARLLTEAGAESVLAPAPTAQHPGFQPSGKADAQLPLVAFTQPSPGGVTVLLHDLDEGRTTSTMDVPCGGESCVGVRVEGVDQGLVFVRTGGGTSVWDPGARSGRAWTPLGTGDFRLADVRNGRILWSGAPPEPAADSPVKKWGFTRGEIDAELSHDGRHILYWSSTLEPVEPGGEPVRLQVRGAYLFTFDTDGSVLAAVSGGPDMRSTIHDCELPSGDCQPVGSVVASSGDPIFIGSDM